MIVDCHTHITPGSEGYGITAYLDECEKIDACIVLGTCGSEAAGSNEQLGRYVKRHGKMVGFASINPVYDSVQPKAVRAATLDIGLEGIVVYCAEGGFHPAHSRAMQLYEAAQELHLPVFFHNDGPFSSGAILDYTQPVLVDEIARTFPGLRIIIGSMGFPFVWQTHCMLGKHRNVYTDLSVAAGKTWQIYNLVLSAYEAGVMDKLLFGSGYPYAKPAECIETLLGFNRMLLDTHLPQVPRQQLVNIVERDSLVLLGLKRPGA